MSYLDRLIDGLPNYKDRPIWGNPLGRMHENSWHRSDAHRPKRLGPFSDKILRSRMEPDPLRFVAKAFERQKRTRPISVFPEPALRIREQSGPDRLPRWRWQWVADTLDKCRQVVGDQEQLVVVVHHRRFRDHHHPIKKNILIYFKS